MQQRVLRVTHVSGLHARPASEFVKEAGKYQSVLQMRNVTGGSRWVNAKSIVSVLTLGVEHGHEVEITAEGLDETAAIASLAGLIESDFAGRL